TLDDVSHQFPEIITAAEKLNRSLILDGEVVGWKDGNVLAFSLLQKRLGRKKPPPTLMEEIPVALMIFDVLYADDRTLIDEPLTARKELIQNIAWPDGLNLAPFHLLSSRAPLETFFAEAEARRNEGLMLKAADSMYAPGSGA